MRARSPVPENVVIRHAIDQARCFVERNSDDSIKCHRANLGGRYVKELLSHFTHTISLQACISVVLCRGRRAHTGLDRVGALFPLFGAVAVRDAAGMSIATFWLLLILQHTDFRQTKAMQLKLDELLRAVEQARIDLVHIEAKPEEQIESLDEEFERLQEQASQRSPSSGAQP